MFVLFSNARGVGRCSKSLALRRLFGTSHLDVICVQQNILCSERARIIFSRILKDWEMCVVDSLGQLGGLLCAWIPKSINYIPFKSSMGIWLECRFLGWEWPVNLFNCYKPSHNREIFWDQIIREGIMRQEDVIFGSDLNFTLSTRQVQGSSGHLDPLSNFFNNILIYNGLIDVEMMSLIPTWNNGKFEAEGIAKRLNCFLIS